MSDGFLQSPLPAAALHQPAAPRPTHSPSAAQARKAAEDFESFFIAQTMEAMFAGIETDGPFGGGHAEQLFRSMLSQEYGKAMSRSGGIGIADQVYREILKTQEVR